MVSRRTGAAAGEGAGAPAVAAPERPPVFMWGRFHDHGDGEDAVRRSVIATGR